MNLQFDFEKSAQRLRADIDAIAVNTLPGEGVTRLPYTSYEHAAKEYLRGRMEEIGLQTHYDGVGTLIGRLEGSDPSLPAIMTGSHIDSVINGGKYDGISGIVCGLEALRQMKENGICPRSSIELIVFTGEEGSRFSGGLISSRAMMGLTSREELEDCFDEDGLNLREAITNAGYSADLISTRLSSRKAFLELHIEQGPILEHEQKQIGVVKSIVGNQRLDMTIRGSAGHAGSTPMALRSDALVSACTIIERLDAYAKACGDGTVATVGKLKVLPGGFNIIPGEVTFSLDIRSRDLAILGDMVAYIEMIANETKHLYHTEWSLKSYYIKEPVDMHPALQEFIRRSAEEAGFTQMDLFSGAGHDAMVIGPHLPTAMIFIPSVKGLSHRPDEYTPIEDLARGTQVLLSSLLKIDACDAL